MMLVNMAVRQTYVVWLAFLGVWTAVVNSARPLRPFTRRAMSFGVAAGTFPSVRAGQRRSRGGRSGGSPRDGAPHREPALHARVLLPDVLPLIVSRLPQIACLHPHCSSGRASMLLYFGMFQRITPIT